MAYTNVGHVRANAEGTHGVAERVLDIASLLNKDRKNVLARGIRGSKRDKQLGELESKHCLGSGLGPAASGPMT